MSERTCLEVGCDEPQLDRGRCEKHLVPHLMYVARKGNKKVVRPKKSWPRAYPGVGLNWLRDKLKNYDGDDCLIFPCGNNPASATVTLNGKSMKATRAMCLLANGQPPEDRPWALHSCGNGHLGCVHPRHLYWGDPSDNAKDAQKHRKDGKPVITKLPGKRPYLSKQASETRRILAAEHNAQQARR